MTPKEDIVRVLRVVEYTGPRSRVEEVVAKSIHGTKDAGRGLIIRAATVGAYPEIFTEPAAEPEPACSCSVGAIDTGPDGDEHSTACEWYVWAMANLPEGGRK